MSWDYDMRSTHLTLLEKRLCGVYLKVGPDDIKAPVIGTLVGEMPGMNTSPELPLFPYPPNSAGGRLLKISGMPTGVFLGRLARVNLLREYANPWNVQEAHKRARILTETFPRLHRVVFLGRRVAESFGFTDFYQIRHTDNETYGVAIPHPSGRNLFYNDPLHREHAKRALQWAANLLVMEIPNE